MTTTHNHLYAVILTDDFEQEFTYFIPAASGGDAIAIADARHDAAHPENPHNPAKEVVVAPLEVYIQSRIDVAVNELKRRLLGALS